ncbi:Uncharacterised protein [Mycobacteroides abscessus]|nr:Uncharacterised protein [Mycobacteroides abscessus]
MREEVDVEPLHAVHDDGPRDGHERHHREGERAPHEDRHGAVLAATSGVRAAQERAHGRGALRVRCGGPARGAGAEGAHQLAPEKSLRRATIARAPMLTSRVMTNSARPVAMRALTPSGFASGKSAAMFAAIVCCCPACRILNE